MASASSGSDNFSGQPGISNWEQKIVEFRLYRDSTISNKFPASVPFKGYYLDAYGVYLTPQSGGKIVITADIDALRPMTKIGVTVLHLYESSNGVDFHLVRTYRSDDYPEMMGTGMHFFEDIITYNGTPGYRYFVDAFCYAGDKTGYDEKAYSSVVKTAVR